MDMKEIKLINGKHTLVDDDIFEKYSHFRWGMTKKGYVRRMIISKKTKKIIKSLLLHQEIIQPKKGQVIDHKNGDTLDNRRENLRICTYSQNQSNRGLQKNNTSGYKGVIWREKERCFYARIGHKKSSHHLGTFKTAMEAAKAYNEAAKKYHGEFARLNKV